MLGCDQYQGYYFSAAMPAHEFADLIRGHGRQQQPGAEQSVEPARSAQSRRRPS